MAGLTKANSKIILHLSLWNTSTNLLIHCKILLYESSLGWVIWGLLMNEVGHLTFLHPNIRIKIVLNSEGFFLLLLIFSWRDRVVCLYLPLSIYFWCFTILLKPQIRSLAALRLGEKVISLNQGNWSVFFVVFSLIVHFFYWNTSSYEQWAFLAQRLIWMMRTKGGSHFKN